MPAVDAFKASGAKLGEVRPVKAGSPDVLGRIKERGKQTDRIQNLEGARLDRRGTRFPMRTHLPLNEPHLHAMAGELASSEQPRGAGADNQDVVSLHFLTRLARRRACVLDVMKNAPANRTQ